jgi:sugar phosphate isomerase/epimerase
VRLGGPVPTTFAGPEEWLALLDAEGYRAAYCPVGVDAPEQLVEEYAAAASETGIVVAEVGAWSNLLARDSDEAARALDLCRRSLALAERIGARCCVNVTGSLGSFWCGPDRRNRSAEALERIVETVQAVVDDVRPSRAFFTLETSPWNYPYDVQSYVELLDAVDRDAVAVHFDPVNLVSSIDAYFATGRLIHEFVDAFGDAIKSCHAKDIRLIGESYTVRLEECEPGTGNLDYMAYLRELAGLDEDLPLMLEHLSSPDTYRRAAEFIRGVAASDPARVADA